MFPMVHLINSNFDSITLPESFPTKTLKYPGSLIGLLSGPVNLKTSSVIMKLISFSSPFFRKIFLNPFSSLTGRVTEATKS